VNTYWRLEGVERPLSNPDDLNYAGEHSGRYIGVSLIGQEFVLWGTSSWFQDLPPLGVEIEHWCSLVLGQLVSDGH
jgi:hypothetical protein